MENKPRLKICLLAAALIVLCDVLLFAVFLKRAVNNYNKSINENSEALVILIHERYPELSYNELIGMVDEVISDAGETQELLKKYGVDEEGDVLFSRHTLFDGNFFLVAAGLLGTEGVLITACFLFYDRRNGRELRKITRCIENINNKIYSMDAADNTEDELSALRNEIYKTTIMLKEEAENSKNSKHALKDSLSDISHQLKTPLTAITINVDNLYANPDMDVEERQHFIKNISRETSNINFLVQNLLKLSRLEADTVSFNNEECKLLDIVNEAVKNIGALADLRGVEIKLGDMGDCTLFCDKKWQCEALSNILKNSVEHSDYGDVVLVEAEHNFVYMGVSITNNGAEICEKDLPHIFDRFYRGENMASDSVGIGLALAKQIIEKNGGSVSVTSACGKTTFVVRYYKKSVF